MNSTLESNAFASRSSCLLARSVTGHLCPCLGSIVCSEHTTVSRAWAPGDALHPLPNPLQLDQLGPETAPNTLCTLTGESIPLNSLPDRFAQGTAYPAKGNQLFAAVSVILVLLSGSLLWLSLSFLSFATAISLVFFFFLKLFCYSFLSHGPSNGFSYQIMMEKKRLIYPRFVFGHHIVSPCVVSQGKKN